MHEPILPKRVGHLLRTRAQTPIHSHAHALYAPVQEELERMQAILEVRPACLCLGCMPVPGASGCHASVLLHAPVTHSPRLL